MSTFPFSRRKQEPASPEALFAKVAICAESVTVPEGFKLLEESGQRCFACETGVRMGLVRAGDTATGLGWGVGHGCVLLWQTINDNGLEAITRWLTWNLEELAQIMRESAMSQYVEPSTDAS